MSDIAETKKLIDKQVSEGRSSMFGEAFSDYQKVYASTNENLNYLSNFDFSGKRSALTVMASGDHAFNLVYNGILDIDTFDVNKLTEYYALGIKRAAILAFNYQEFMIFGEKINNELTSLDEICSIINYLLQFMDLKHRIFWQEIMNYNYKLQKDKKVHINLFNMVLLNPKSLVNETLKNPYLINEENYNKLRLLLSKADIRFKKADCLELDKEYTGGYDFILLSNIADYLYKSFGYNWSYKKFQEFSFKMKKLLNKDGIVALAYLINSYSVRTGRFITHPIQGSNVTINDLTTEEVITVPDIVANVVNKNSMEGLIFERKK